MISKRDKQAIGQRLLARFRAAGADEIAPDILLPAESLLDLYGEDIRARAYVTNDPIRGEMMLRPDFTVPVVQAHMYNRAEPARYCYLGEVFRKQDSGDTHPNVARDHEYLQCGFELFSRDPQADAEVFALFHDILSPLNLQARMGDMRLLLDAVAGLPLTQARKHALSHHLWRPKRFARLLSRFSGPIPPREEIDCQAPWSGLREESAMQARMMRLREDALAPALDPIWTERLQQLFALRAPAPQALSALDNLARVMPAIIPAVCGIKTRLHDIAARGIALENLWFDASHGRTTLEYYDGFTFSFVGQNPHWPAVASGGRYDALTRILGKGKEIPAVGGIIRPGLVAELEVLA